MQVNYKFLKTVKENPGRVATIGAALMTTGLAAGALTMAGGSDEQRRLLANMPARELGRALYFPHWDGKKLIRIRMPENIGAFVGLAQLFVIANYTKQKARFDDYVDVATAFVPDQFNVIKPEQLVLSWVPHVLSPSIETATNIRTYPDVAPIVPEYMIENLPPEEQYYEYTTKTAKAIGKLLNASPAKVEYWIRNQLGAVGGAAIGHLPNNPLIRQEEHFVTRGRAYSYFYDDKISVNRIYNTMDETLSREEKKAIIADKVVYDKVADVLSNIRNTIKKGGDVSEPIKNASFELLVRINNHETGEAIYGDVEQLNKAILEYAQSNNIGLTRKYNVTRLSIQKSILDYEIKNGLY
jgi:hypothetical protein